MRVWVMVIFMGEALQFQVFKTKESAEKAAIKFSKNKKVQNVHLEELTVE